jgi:uncharacterized protein
VNASILDRLEDRVRSYRDPRAMVAFSGGVDSAVVLAVAARALGADAVTAATAVSPSYPSGELDDAREIASSLGVGFLALETREVESQAYARNDALRCFHCKTELYSTLRRVAGATGPGTVILAGANAEDSDDFRPGLRAADDFGVRSPLLEEGVRKADVRTVARCLRLPVADRPPMACLSSRVAFGVPITPELLARIDGAERRVRALGFDPARVRHRGVAATIEVDPAQVERLRRHPAAGALLSELRAMGWRTVEIDPGGYRAGAMNSTLVNLQVRR